MTAPFDTLALAEALKGTPLGKDGAEAVARAMADVAMADVATKRDLTELGDRLERAMLRQTIALGGIVAAIAAVATTVLKLLS
ncbi:hypothetical protein [Sphingomonas sp. NFR15]|uniref:hypothetical protein n=1 Tax=Sphingomonas sp. NFR15 TaxID=1566282 RepID=UPI0008834CEF|nr:hypothetical protein [Sphingomonas sp. NFR15]SDA14748.1 hypothetical protein SAMN03159340_00588 [Sphingomonas sp. NFR15]